MSKSIVDKKRVNVYALIFVHVQNMCIIQKDFWQCSSLQTNSYYARFPNQGLHLHLLPLLTHWYIQHDKLDEIQGLQNSFNLVH